jgi:hypothetical protein
MDKKMRLNIENNQFDSDRRLYGEDTAIALANDRMHMSQDFKNAEYLSTLYLESTLGNISLRKFIDPSGE